MGDEVMFRALAEHGPWVMLVFYLLWRDLQKDQATRELLTKNTHMLVEMATLVRERLPKG
jgi:hypothetical protein